MTEEEYLFWERVGIIMNDGVSLDVARQLAWQEIRDGRKEIRH